MTLTSRLTTAVLTALLDVADRLRARAANDRGDVPGWVLITLMTAALVLVIWGLASASFADLWQRAMDMVGVIK